MDNNYSDIPDWLKRDCELRGITIAEFLEVQKKCADYIDSIRKSFISGELVNK